MRNILALFAILHSIELSAKPQINTQHFDNVLERLEQRLLDQESQDLLLKTNENKNEKFSIHSKPKDLSNTKKQHFKKQIVTSSTPEMRSLQSLGEMINQLELQVEQFSHEVQKTTQIILDEANINNYVDLTVTLPSSSVAVLTKLQVKIDGFMIHNQRNVSDIFDTSQSIPLYSGPFPPGNHRIDIETQLVKRRSDSIPVNESTAFLLSQSFDIDTSLSDMRSRYTFLIVPGTSKTSEFQISMQKDE